MNSRKRFWTLIITGGLLMIYFMIVCVADLQKLQAFQEKLLGLLGAAFAAIIGWAIPGKSVLAAKFQPAKWFQVTLDATGSIVCFFFFLLWWTGPSAPIETNKNISITQWIVELRDVPLKRKSHQPLSGAHPPNVIITNVVYVPPDEALIARNADSQESASTENMPNPDGSGATSKETNG